MARTPVGRLRNAAQSISRQCCLTIRHAHVHICAAALLHAVMVGRNLDPRQQRLNDSRLLQLVTQLCMYMYVQVITCTTQEHALAAYAAMISASALKGRNGRRRSAWATSSCDQSNSMGSILSQQPCNCCEPLRQPTAAASLTHESFGVHVRTILRLRACFRLCFAS